MPIDSHDDPTLPPPGCRSGSGAQSVLPYLTKTLQSRPAAAPEHARDSKPAADARPERASPPTA